MTCFDSTTTIGRLPRFLATSSNIVVRMILADTEPHFTLHIKLVIDIEDDRFAIPPWEKLMKYRVVVCSCLDASILVAAQCTSHSLSRLEREVLSSLHPRRQQVDAPPHWTHLLIDEVSHLRFSARYTIR